MGYLLQKFEFDILDSNLIPREEFNGGEWPKLIGDILVDVIDRQENAYVKD